MSKVKAFVDSPPNISISVFPICMAAQGCERTKSGLATLRVYQRWLAMGRPYALFVLSPVNKEKLPVSRSYRLREDGVLALLPGMT